MRTAAYGTALGVPIASPTGKHCQPPIVVAGSIYRWVDNEWHDATLPGITQADVHDAW